MEDQTGKLRAFIERMKQEAGGDNEIVRQCVADLNAQQRQDARNHFESRQEYIRQIAELNLADRRGIMEYGQYRRDTLIARYGTAVTMPDLRHLVAQCPFHEAPGPAPL